MLPATLGGAFADVQHAIGQPALATAGRPKSTVMQAWFQWAAIDGMTDPFFLETLVNSDALPVERPFIVTHEWSHLAGFAHEAEANFLAWVICQRADTQAQYARGSLSTSISPADSPPPIAARSTPISRMVRAATCVQLLRGISVPHRAYASSPGRYAIDI